ncbi:MAG: phosphonopyruvate decarboxylase [Ignavibacteriales bacterium]|nr:phosphonopyruvate decarboxylase [Ignavibacteriales bacterium]
MKALDFINALKENGISDFTGVPCSTFKPVIHHLEKSEHYIIASSEGEAMGIAAGISLSGNTPAVFMQNDGFGNTVNPLTSLTKLYEFPTLLVISWRGEPGVKDAPQHVWSGKTLLELMKVFEIEYHILTDELEADKKEIKRLIDLAKNENKVCAIICRKEIFEKEKIEQTVSEELLSRMQAIETALSEIEDEIPIFSTTGMPSREIYQVKDRKNNFYTVGSMGCTSSIAFGYFLKTKKKVAVFDGDGAVLLKMGTLATLGYYQPEKLLHICLDNESYESTGGQSTISTKIILSDVAIAAGYKNVKLVKSKDEITEFIKKWKANPSLSFLHIKVKNQTDHNIGRPKESPAELKKRFMETN